MSDCWPWEPMRTSFLLRLRVVRPLPRLGALLDPNQLTTPVAFEHRRPFVQRPDRLGVRAIEHLLALAPDVDEAHVAEHFEVLGHGRLAHPQAVDNLADRTLVGRQEREDVAPARFG